MNSKLENKFIKNNMLVAVRSRPLSQKELQFSNISTIKIQNREKLTIINPIQYKESEEGDKYINNEKNLIITKTKEKQYAFDFAFDEETTQEDIYHFTTEMLINKVMEGFNATVFAYGATGSGKTYTMVGDDKNPGIMIRAISDLFNALNQVKNVKYNVSISYIEIYNEQLKDLLDNNNYNNNNKNNIKDNKKEINKIDIRTDPQKGTFLYGVSLHQVICANDAFKLLVYGNKNRTEGITEQNENSSRSHGILQINIESQDSNLSLINKIAFGKFILVDLAGSEKVSATSKINNESGSINKSLLALGNCINALTSNGKHIPWRDSKLTRMLQDSLSGNCRIVMIANISPGLMCIDETMHTLQYANRAKNIKINVQKNIVQNNNIGFSKYDEIIDNLKEEIMNVRNEIALKEKINGNLLNMNNNNYINNNNNNGYNNKNDNSFDNEDNKMQNELIRHFQEEIRIKNEIIDKEMEIENIKMEIAEDEFKMNSNPTINISVIKQLIDSKNNEIETKQKNLSNSYIHQSNLITMRKTFEKKINDLIEENMDSPQTKNLVSIYKYYINLLENMNSEHRKNLNENELKRKDIKIKLLTEQLDYRDKYILNAGQEIANNNGVFNYNNPKFQTADEIDLNPYKPKVVKVISNMNNIMNNTRTTISNPPSSIRKENNNFNSFYSYNNNRNLSPFKRKSPSPIKVSKFRQYNDDLENLSKNKNINSYLEKFQRNKALRNNLSQNLINNGNNAVLFNHKRNSFSNFKKNIVNNPLNNIQIKINDDSQENSILDNNTSRLENEVEKKVKTILKRNILGRYRRSPYIQNFQNLN